MRLLQEFILPALFLGCLCLAGSGIFGQIRPSVTVDYASAALPKDKEAAWEMLREASGLHGENMAPWVITVHYKTYDEAGLPRGEGDLKYQWVASNHWRMTYTEGGTTWDRLVQPEDHSTEAGFSFGPGYPEWLVLPIIRAPLDSVPEAALPYLHEQNLGGALLACFENTSSFPPQANYVLRPEYILKVCSMADRPILRFLEGDYTEIFDKLSSFQGQIVAQHVSVQDGKDRVLDFQVTELRSLRTEEIAALQPSAGEQSGTSNSIDRKNVFMPSKVLQGRILKRVPLPYPQAAKEARIQGVVRLLIEIQPDGSTKVIRLLHSPDPALTASTEKGVAQWRYSPYLLNGKPVSVMSVVRANYTLER